LPTVQERSLSSFTTPSPSIMTVERRVLDLTGVVNALRVRDAQLDA
jgi:hypothetical protein